MRLLLLLPSLLLLLVVLALVSLSWLEKSRHKYLIWSHNLVKKRKKKENIIFQNMTDGSMFMTFACYSVVWGYEEIFIAANSLHLRWPVRDITIFIFP